jgi:PTH1 family peptidyl-tRNA hydrolase
MKLIIGLGNPGKKYEYTRHNAGFEVLELLSSKLGLKINKIKFKALYCEGIFNNEKIVLLMPQTFMNLSGEAVREAMSFYKIGPEDIIVIFDDIDIEPGKIKIRKKGSAGTHNGMRSIIYQIKSEDFVRIRVGIGKHQGSMELSDYVLMRIPSNEKEIMNEAFEKSSIAVLDIIEKGTDYAMNKHNI